MPVEFIHVADAKRRIGENTDLLEPLKIPLQDAAGLVLAEDVFSTTDIPPFNQSSMDGYALNFNGWKTYKHLKIEGVASAGMAEHEPLMPQNATRIFTGAVVPSGADTVVMQEKVKADKGQLFVEDTNLVAGLNIRLQGSEIKSGELALEKNTILTPAAIGFLVGVGTQEVVVFPRPSISIIVTGNELQEQGKSLEHGQVL